MADAHDNVLELMRTQNKQTMKRIRDQGEGLDPNTCSARPVFAAHADGQEQTFRNQEFMVEHMIKHNGSSTATIPTPVKKFSLWGLKLEGFSVRDILRLVVIVALVLVVFHLLGMKEQVTKVQKTVTELKANGTHPE